MPQLNINPQKAFLGVGWNFPPQLDTTGSVQLAEYEQDVQQAILIILGTNPGERVMRPDFGAGLNQFVFEPVNGATMSAIAAQVNEALVELGAAHHCLAGERHHRSRTDESPPNWY